MQLPIVLVGVLLEELTERIAPRHLQRYQIRVQVAVAVDVFLHLHLMAAQAVQA
jgi:hypothetical protein